jgi:heme A synthase
VNDPLATVSSDAGTGLRLVRGAALRFWFVFILGASVAGLAVNAAHGDCGGPEWGGCFGPFLIVFALVASTGLGLVAAVSYGVAIFLLRHRFALMVQSHRVASSALTTLAVLVVGYFVLTLGPPEEAGWRLVIVVGLLPFLLSIVVVPVVSRLRGTQGDEGAV